MREKGHAQFAMFVPVDVEEHIEVDDPVRLIKIAADYVLRELNDDFNDLYGDTGRPSIPTEYFPAKSLRLLSTTPAMTT